MRTMVVAGAAILCRLTLVTILAADPGTFGWTQGASAGTSVPRTHGPVTRKVVKRQTDYPAGTIVISTQQRTLDLVLDRSTVARYAIGVARDGFRWSGIVKVGRKAEWPQWRPPPEMRERVPGLPAMVPAGPLNPLGARAIYLYRGGKDTLYRIHGTNDVSSIGGFASSGCFRMTNADILELYGKVRLSSKVVVE